MKYVPPSRKDTINHNISYDHPLETALKLSASVVFMVAVIFMIFAVSMEVLIRYNTSYATALISSLTPAHKEYTPSSKEEKELHTRLTSIYEKMRVHLPGNVSHRFSVIPNSSPNAFAHPDGTIVFHTRTGEMLKSETELAMVVAHELGHYHHDHHLQRVSRVFALLLTSFIVTNGYSSSNGLIDTFLELLLYSYTQEQEKEADYFGLDLVYKTYGNVEGATKFFEDLGKDEISWIASDIFSTHPGSEKRVQYLRKRAQEMRYIELGL
jgi:Zn-dependent protease with chaperone function